LFIHSELPVGGGVSSSAALEVGFAKALLALAGEGMGPVPLALLARQAEHEYAHSPCGIMDQFVSVLGRANHALLLDCRSQTYEQIPLSLNDAAFVVMDTQVKHEIGSSEYAARQQQCRDGLAILQSSHPQAAALRDVTSAMLECQRDQMGPVLWKRCRHVVTEIERTRQAAEALRRGKLETFGRLMYDSHASLRDDYEVSCRELDRLVEVARRVEGVYGARMTGGGFGGCAVALARREAEAPLRAAIGLRYDRGFHQPAVVYTTTAADGASVQSL
jgi:galactokinase